MRLSLRYRLLLPLLLLLAGDAAATGWAAWSAARHVDQRIAEQLRAVARTLSEPGTFPLTEGVLQKMKGLSGADFLLVPTIGATLGTFGDPQPAPPSDSDPTPLVMVANREYRYLRLPLTKRSEGGTLFVFYPEELRQTAVWDAARPLLWLGGVGGLVAVGLASIIGGRLVGRVRALDRQARAIADGNFQRAALPTQNDELRDLASSVNEMASRLAEYRDALALTERLRVLGQFSGGLAHQLRNAATGARLAIEVHLNESPPADREPLEVALRQLARMETMLRQFLDLGRPPPATKQPCDLREIVDQAVELLQPQCLHTNTTLRWERAGEPALMSGDATQLEHLFGNLIGNAIEAAGPGGRVDVRCFRFESVIRVEVSDTGPGPPAELAERLFDPFVTGKDQGIGLGLAVAKQAADAHGGTIAWERREGRTVFRVALPKM